MVFMNLYTFLIDNVDNKFCFGRVVDESIESGCILVNNNRPTDVNMILNIGDIITVNGVNHKVNERCFEAYAF